MKITIEPKVACCRFLDQRCAENGCSLEEHDAKIRDAALEEAVPAVSRAILAGFKTGWTEDIAKVVLPAIRSLKSSPPGPRPAPEQQCTGHWVSNVTDTAGTATLGLVHPTPHCPVHSAPPPEPKGPQVAVLPCTCIQQGLPYFSSERCPTCGLEACDRCWTFWGHKCGPCASSPKGEP
jgi:hypothetical protein